MIPYEKAIAPAQAEDAADPHLSQTHASECHFCGKSFDREHSKLVKMPDTHGTECMFCNWHCYSAWDEEVKELAANIEAAVKAREALIHVI